MPIIINNLNIWKVLEELIFIELILEIISF